MSSSSFIHLHTHSHFSIQDGVPPVRALVKKASDLEMPALALTDHNTLGGIVEFINCCSEYGIKPIIGCELDVSHFEKTKSTKKTYHLTVLVENETGYRNLVRLISRAHPQPHEEHPPGMPFSDLREHNKGLIVLTGCYKGQLFELMKGNDLGAIERYLGVLADIFDERNIYFELQMHSSPNQEKNTRRIHELADYLKMPSVITNNVHYLEPEDAIAYDFLTHRNLGTAATVEAVLEDARRTMHLTSETEMKERFFYCPKAFYTTMEIADRCNYVPHFSRNRFPVHDLDRGFDPDSYLWDCAFKEAEKIYGTLNDTIKERLNTEFNYIKQHMLTNHLLILYKLVSHLEKKRIIAGFGNSGMSTSLVAYVLGLTRIDPINYDLEFRGFNLSEDQLPPLEIEIPSRYISEVAAHLCEMYGEHFVANVGKYVYWHKGTLLSDICEWLSISTGRINAFLSSKDLSSRKMSDAPLKDFIARSTDTTTLRNLNLASALLFTLHPRPRSFASTPGEFVVSGENLNDLVPRTLLSSSLPSTQFDKTTLNLLNIPHIAVHSPTQLNITEETLRWIESQEGRTLSLPDIPYNDTATFQLLGKGLTNGIAPMASISMKSLLRTYRPQTMQQLLKIMRQVRDNKAEDEISDHDAHIKDLWDSILGYRSAYLKTHYPVSFTTALLNHYYKYKKCLNILLNEARRAGIKILPPDVNYSEYHFSQEGKSVRTGLMVVKLMGEKAFEEIESLRRGGAFVDLLDFCQRTDPRCVPFQLIRNLIKAGGFDSSDWNRAQNVYVLDMTIKSTRRKGDTSDDAPSFLDFSVFENVEREETFEPPALDELPSHTLITQEIEATGYSTTQSPLALYQSTIEHIRALSPFDLSLKLDNTEQYIVGYIDTIDRTGPLMKRTIRAVLDLEGYVVLVPETVYTKYASALYDTEPVLIGGVVSREKEETTLIAHSIIPLGEIEKKAAEIERITLDLTGEDQYTLKVLNGLCKMYPGSTAIDIVNYEGRGRRRARALSHRAVYFCPPFYFALIKMLSESRATLVSKKPSFAQQ